MINILHLSNLIHRGACGQEQCSHAAAQIAELLADALLEIPQLDNIPASAAAIEQILVIGQPTLPYICTCFCTADRSNTHSRALLPAAAGHANFV